MSKELIKVLELIQSDLEAARDDCQSEEAALRDGEEIDAGMIDGAIFHAESAVGRLQQLRETLTKS